MEAAGLPDSELGAFLRRHGLHESQIEEWRRAALAALQTPKKNRPRKSPEAKRVVELERELYRKDRALAEITALLALKKTGFSFGGRGRRHDAQERTMILGEIDVAATSGARLSMACEIVGLPARTIQRWRAEGGGEDRRCGPNTVPANKLSAAERTQVLQTVNSAEFRDLSPKQIVPSLADRGEYR